MACHKAKQSCTGGVANHKLSRKSLRQEITREQIYKDKKGLIYKDEKSLIYKDEKGL